MLGALGLQGLVAAMTVAGFTDGEVFLAFLREGLMPQLQPGQVLIMDNLTAHNVAGVADACATAGVRLLALPPYAPDWSPIAACGSKVKALVRAKAARTLAALEPAIAEALAAITSQEAQGGVPMLGIVWHPTEYRCQRPPTRRRAAVVGHEARWFCLSKPRIDNATDLMVTLQKIRLETGYEAVGFTSGKATLAALQEWEFDLCLVDLMMPDMDGIALLTAAQAIDLYMIGIILIA
jgi:transposase